LSDSHEEGLVINVNSFLDDPRERVDGAAA
jgi:hypothetical protein